MTNMKDVNEAFGEDKKWKKMNLEQGNSWNFREDKVLVGVYTGSHTAETKFGVRTIWDIQKLDGTLMSVWETAMLKRAFDQIPVGTELRITFLGKVPGQKGNSVNTFDIETA